MAAECLAIPAAVDAFEATLAKVQEPIRAFTPRRGTVRSAGEFADSAAVEPYEKDRKKLLAELGKFAKGIAAKPPAAVRAQHAAREAFGPGPSGIKGLIKQIDLVAKLAGHAHDDIAHLLPHRLRIPLRPPRRGAGC